MYEENKYMFNSKKTKKQKQKNFKNFNFEKCLALGYYTYGILHLTRQLHVCNVK